MKERKDRVEDGMHATKAAVEEGVVAGGGVALLFASKVLEGLNPEQGSSTGRFGMCSGHPAPSPTLFARVAWPVQPAYNQSKLQQASGGKSRS